MVSSVREKMIEVEKAKKLATRAAETGVVLEKVELVRARDKEAKKAASKKRGRPRKKV